MLYVNFLIMAYVLSDMFSAVIFEIKMKIPYKFLQFLLTKLYCYKCLAFWITYIYSGDFVTACQVAILAIFIDKFR